VTSQVPDPDQKRKVTSNKPMTDEGLQFSVEDQLAGAARLI
jgi:hypothetical protein